MLPAKAPGQNSIGTGGQDSIGANSRWDLIAELRADNLETFDRVLNDIRKVQGIASTETSILLSTHKA